jgi:hypothetical protein
MEGGNQMLLKENYDDYLMFQKNKEDFEDDVEQMEEIEDQMDKRKSEKYCFELGGSKVTAVIDNSESQLLLKRIENVNSPFQAKRLILGLINDLEKNYSLDMIIWEISKKYGDLVKIAADCGFEVYTTEPYSIKMAYHLLSFSAPSALFNGGGPVGK